MYHESESDFLHTIWESVTEFATKSRPNRTSVFREKNVSNSLIDLSELQEIFSIEMRADLAEEVAGVNFERNEVERERNSPRQRDRTGDRAKVSSCMRTHHQLLLVASSCE